MKRLNILFLLLLSASLIRAQIPVSEPLLFIEGSLFKEMSTPVSIPSGYGWVYSKSDNKLYFKNDAGTEYDLTLGGSGTVTSFSSGNFSPLFTTSVTNSTTTPSLSFTGISQLQNLVYASPNGSSGVPSFRSLAVADIGGLTPDLFLFGKSDGTIDQDPYGYYDKVNHYLRLGDPAGLAAVPGAELVLTSGTHAAGITATSLGSSVTVSSGLGQTYMDGLYYRFVNLDGDAFAIGRATYSTDEVLLFPAAKGTANKTLYVSSVVGDDVTLSWGDFTTGTVTSFAFTDGSGFDGTVSNATTTPTLSLTTSLTENYIPHIGSSGELLGDVGLQYNPSTDRAFINGSLDIGAISSSYNLHVSEDAQVEFVGDAGNSQKVFIGGRSFSGTVSSPAATQTGQLMVEFGAGGHTGSSFTSSSTAMMRIYPTESFTPSANGTQIRWYVTNNGSTSQTRAMTLDQDAELGIGVNTPSEKLDVDGNINVSAGNTYKVNGTALSATAETLTNKTINGNSNTLSNIGRGYTLTLTGSQGTFADPVTLYGGAITTLTSTTAGINQVPIPKSGTITDIYVFQLTAGATSSGESSTMAVRINNTTDVTISSAVLNSSGQLNYSATGLSQAVTAGDYVEFKFASATWATNPTNVRWTVVIFIKES